MTSMSITPARPVATAVQTGQRQRPFLAIARCLLAFLILAILAIFAGPASAQQCVEPPPGAVYWLAGENSFDDLAGFHHGGRGDTGVAFIPGQVGTAMRFDDIDDRIVADVTSAEQRELLNTFSYEMWARPTATLGSCPQSNTSNCSGVQLRWTVFPNHPDSIGLAGASGFGIGVGTNGICAGEHAGNLVNCLARLDTAINDWAHIVVVVEDKTPHIYLNGVLEHSGIASNQSFVVASWQVIGTGLGLGSFTGDLDEYTIYGRGQVLDKGRVVVLDGLVKKRSFRPVTLVATSTSLHTGCQTRELHRVHPLFSSNR